MTPWPSLPRPIPDATDIYGPLPLFKLGFKPEEVKIDGNGRNFLQRVLSESKYLPGGPEKGVPGQSVQSLHSLSNVGIFIGEEVWTQNPKDDSIESSSINNSISEDCDQSELRDASHINDSLIEDFDISMNNGGWGSVCTDEAEIEKLEDELYEAAGGNIFSKAKIIQSKIDKIKEAKRSTNRDSLQESHSPNNPVMDELRQNLEKYGQGHLLDFWDQNTDEENEILKADIDNVDLEYTTQSFERCTQAAEDKANAGKLDDRMMPVPIDICGSVSNLDPETKKTYENNTFEAIVKGQYAVLLLAGGQGTRLGVSYPKGMYDVGLPSKKTLFQLQAERLLKLQTLASEAMGGQQCKSGIAWYIMTSKTTIEPTRNFFEKKDYFGLKKENVRFFEQGTLPCFSFAGKILMDSKYQLARAPDGNGGLYRALKKDGILEDMKNRGIEHVQLYCVDNILVKIGDPLFTGYCIEKGAECANKVVPKGFPTESVGITAQVDGKYQVVEYSEITKESAEKRNADGSLTYSAANICIHYFTRKFLDRVVGEHERDLVHHVAKKKIPYIDSSTGLRVTPDRPNGIKMEKFVFDVFQFAEENSFAVWECIREEEFAPLKNANGASDFTPMHCRKAVFAYHQKLVMKAGGYLVNDLDRKLSLLDSPATPKEVNNNLDADEMFQGEESKVEIICEIAPSVTYAGEGLEKLVKGQRFKIPCNLPL